jgi:galactose mutarotase-like enzyme
MAWQAHDNFANRKTTAMSPLLLENDHLSIRVLAEAGGKILSLRGVPDGRDWLWQNPHLPVAAAVYGASYVETMDSGGWDEVFPSVLADEIGGLSIPDHGDLVGLPWQVVEHSPDRLVMEVRTRFAPCLFRRAMLLIGDRLEIHYKVRNEGALTVPYLWCAHPLIALEPGMRLLIPNGVRMSLAGGVGFAPLEKFDWPHLPGAGAVDVIPDPGAQGFQPLAVKMFTAPGTVGRVALERPSDGGMLEFEWNPAEIPHLGLWMNLGAWSGCGSLPYFNLGIEPSTAPVDRLGDACDQGSVRRLEPGAEASWTLSVRLKAGE